jgi:hypothetical protein
MEEGNDIQAKGYERTIGVGNNVKESYRSGIRKESDGRPEKVVGRTGVMDGRGVKQDPVCGEWGTTVCHTNALKGWLVNPMGEGIASVIACLRS